MPFVRYRFPFASLLAATALALALTGCGKRYEWHQKLTLEVETPGGTLTGYSVQAAYYEDNAWFGAVNGPASRIYLRGEAVAVPLRENRVLFMLLPEGSLAYQTYTDPADGPARERIRKMLAGKHDRVELPRADYPALVVFKDNLDPESAATISPFGDKDSDPDGPRISRVTIEMTEEPITTGVVESILPWLNDPSVMTNPGWKKLNSASKAIIDRLRARDWRTISDN